MKMGLKMMKGCALGRSIIGTKHKSLTILCVLCNISTESASHFHFDLQMGYSMVR
jgi:hypothetical protein